MIVLINGYQITNDTRQYILQKKIGVNKKTGEDIFKNISYCSTLDYALVCAYRHIGKDRLRKEKYTITEAIELFQDIEKRLRKIITEGASPESLDFADGNEPDESYKDYD